ncbi:DNA-formamidopyrimidine glycosylase family protein [Ilumatobacter sp.]|uniref:DNA-formamidopyrimidine glycosylase family protein n=1 Tax=Ilumatobacter sp. TaxID=1967498 RepID=UPI003B52199B
MPEMPELHAHAERLEDGFVGRVLTRFHPFNFTALKTAVPSPDDAYGHPLRSVGRRGKYLLLRFEPVTFVVHLMQGGRLLADARLAKKPRGAQARFLFEPVKASDGGVDGSALLLTEHGTERRAGVWCVSAGDEESSTPLEGLGPEAAGISAEALAQRFADERSQRVHGFLRDQRMVAGIGRRLANEVCWEARTSPFATTRALGAEGARAIAAAIEVRVESSLAEERARGEMSSSKDRTSAVHGRAGEPCPRAEGDDDHDVVRAVEYSGYTVSYCPTCQTGGKVLADNTTSRFLK